MRAALRLAASGERPAARVPAAPSARVLVVDDEVALGRALRRFMRGYEIVHCLGMSEAYERIRGGEVFDVVVSDVMMPGGNGPELYAMLQREVPDLAERTIFMTGGATTPETIAFVEEHADRVLEKPLDLAEFRRRVDALVASRGLLARAGKG